jgi:hypothetical protein
MVDNNILEAERIRVRGQCNHMVKNKKKAGNAVTCNGVGICSFVIYCGRKDVLEFELIRCVQDPSC